MRNSRLNEFLSTWHFVFVIIGYAFFAAIGAPFIGGYGENLYISIPYRGAMLILALWVIFLNRGEKLVWSAGSVAYLILWILFILRLFYEALCGNIEDSFRLWSYVWAIDIAGLLAVAKSCASIKFDKVVWRVIVLGTIALSFIVYSNGGFGVLSEMGRAGLGNKDYGSILGTISYGHLGVIVAILSLYAFFKTPFLNVIKKILLVGCCLLGLLSMLYAGSRGPFLSFVVVIVLWYGFNKKNFLFVIVGTSFVSLFVWFFRDFIINDVVGKFAPVLAARLSEAENGNWSGRDIIYENFWNCFINSPICGTYNPSGHNLFLEILANLGILGGVVFLIASVGAFLCGRDMFLKSQNPWIFLLFIQQLVFSMTSSGFIALATLHALWALILFYKFKEVKNNTIIYS